MGPMTVDQAEELIGVAGKVVNPSKGEWPLKHRVTGYHVNPDNPEIVDALKLESVDRTGPITYVEMLDNGGSVTKTVDSHPVEVTGRVNPRWFKPDDQPVGRTAPVPAPGILAPASPASAG